MCVKLKKLFWRPAWSRLYQKIIFLNFIWMKSISATVLMAWRLRRWTILVNRWMSWHWKKRLTWQPCLKGLTIIIPKTKYEAAVGRRNWVIDRMVEDEYVTPDEAEAAKQKPLTTVERNAGFVKKCPIFQWGSPARNQCQIWSGCAVWRRFDCCQDNAWSEIAGNRYPGFSSGAEKLWFARHGWRGAR